MKITPDPSYPKIITFVKGTGFQVVFTLLTLFLILFYNICYYILCAGYRGLVGFRRSNSEYCYYFQP